MREIKLLKMKIHQLDHKLTKEIALDIAFPNRTDSKTEELKGKIMDLVRQRDERLRGE